MIARKVASPTSGIKSNKLFECSMRLRKRSLIYMTSNILKQSHIMSQAGYGRFVFINDCAAKLPMLNLARSLWQLRTLIGDKR